MNETTDPSPAPEPSLDDVISEFNVPAPASEPTHAPTVPQTPQTNHTAFDPLDQESVNNYVKNASERETALTRELQSLSGKVTDMEQNATRKLVESDIKSAVQKVNEKANLDPAMVEFYLDKMVREKPGFETIWNNRTQNPTAFNKALDAISTEIQGKFAVKSDPDLVKNQQAATQSQQTTSAKDEPDSPFDGLTPGSPEWNQQWAILKAG